MSKLEIQREWHRQNPDRQLHYDVSHRYGISGEDYQQMLEAQGGVCAICGNEETITRNGKVKRLGVDHCHKTGAVRGLLCENCNRALGMLQDDPQRALAAMEYLLRTGWTCCGEPECPFGPKCADDERRDARRCSFITAAGVRCIRDGGHEGAHNTTYMFDGMPHYGTEKGEDGYGA